MILVIRISGMVNMPPKAKETLYRLRLRRKYAAVILKDNQENRKLLARLRNYVAFGNIDQSTAEKIITTRGQLIDKTKKIDVKKASENLSKDTLQKNGLKPFFRLHPPRGGIEAKKHFGVGKGVLGDHKNDIHKLVLRML